LFFCSPILSKHPDEALDERVVLHGRADIRRSVDALISGLASDEHDAVLGQYAVRGSLRDQESVALIALRCMFRCAKRRVWCE
jgi:hypothetical protein